MFSIVWRQSISTEMIVQKYAAPVCLAGCVCRIHRQKRRNTQEEEEEEEEGASPPGGYDRTGDNTAKAAGNS